MAELPSEDTRVGATDDLASLAKLDENILLNELKVRFHKQNIYTYVGDILVALNPYEDLGLYTQSHINQYKNAARRDNPPHIFAVSDSMYQSMIGRHGHVVNHQCALISGESGAGKTESTKLLIQQIMELVHGNVQLEQQILQVNPLLEAFGNAQTVMNNNSSRFGKYILLKFHKGRVIGAKISEYLLEKSRLSVQSRGEQNFHIFYYMLAGFGEEERRKYHMRTPKDYRYICDGAVNFSGRIPEYKKGYEELINAMDMVGFTEEEQEDMFRILSSAITFGNVKIGTDEEGNAVIEDSEDLKIATELSGMNKEEIRSVLTSSVTTTRGESITKRYRPLQTEDARDALAKMMYGRLFSWIVNKINSLLVQDNVSADDIQQIGILDIFGFEHLENNSFEQACINLANEQLQFFFNKHIFMLEQEEYKKEGVDWKEIKFVDNQPLLNLFLDRPIGLLALLDEESFFPNGNDRTFVDKLDDKFKKQSHYVPTKGSNTKFAINHYAGKVDYNSMGWLEKNRDTLLPGVLANLKDSKNTLLRMIFCAKISRTGTLAMQGRMAKSRQSTVDAAKRAAQARANKLTVGTQFKTSLGVLMEQMSEAKPVFIRCIKPNNDKKSKTFHDKYVTSQLLYTGMLETTKIRREGFAVRPSFQEFVEKYQILALNCSMPHDKKSCQKLLKYSNLKGYQIGKTKVFLKYWHLDQLGECLLQLAKTVIFVQKTVRGFLDRRRVRKLRLIALMEAQKMENLLEHISGLQIELTKQQTACKQYDQDEQIRKEREIQIQREHDEQERLRQEQESFPAPPPPIIDIPDEIVEPEERVTKIVTIDESANVTEGDIMEDEPRRNRQPQSSFTRAATVRWFQDTQKNMIRDNQNEDAFADWFHGIITRRESERLLSSRQNGCFLIRVSESRFGYSLSFKASSRCRHYMIDQVASGKYVIIGEPKVHKTLHDMVDYHRKWRLCNWDGLLTQPCGQEDGQCDYAELVDVPYMTPSPTNRSIYSLDPNLMKMHTNGHADGYQNVLPGYRSSTAQRSSVQSRYSTQSHGYPPQQRAPTLPHRRV